MGFNYGLEKKNFDRQWTIIRKQYEDAGMSSEAIRAMYEYDWSVFNAARSYQNHTQEIAAPSFEQGEESYSPLMNKYTMVDKFSQVAGNIPVTNDDPNRRYTVINGYPVVLSFAKEPNPGVFDRIRDILLATSYTKTTS